MAKRGRCPWGRTVERGSVVSSPLITRDNTSKGANSSWGGINFWGIDKGGDTRGGKRNTRTVSMEYDDLPALSTTRARNISGILLQLGFVISLRALRMQMKWYKR